MSLDKSRLSLASCNTPIITPKKLTVRPEVALEDTVFKQKKNCIF
jgi:hypothetical protein